MAVDVSGLTKTLIDYNPEVNRVAEAMNSSLLVVASILLSLFFLLELNSWEQMSGRKGGKLTLKLWGELAFKYLMIWCFMLYSAQLLDALMWLFNACAKLVLKDVTLSDFTYTFELGKVKGAEKILLNLVGKSVELIVSLIVALIGIIRYMDLYFFKAVAPLFIVCFMNEYTKSIALNFLKYFVAVVLVTLGLTVVSYLYPVLMSKANLMALVDVSSGGIGTALISLGHGLLFIIAVVGMSRRMTRLLGV